MSPIKVTQKQQVVFTAPSTGECNTVNFQLINGNLCMTVDNCFAHTVEIINSVGIVIYKKLGETND